MEGNSSNIRATLIFSDFRMFGRVLFDCGDGLPTWWTSIAPAINSSGFTRECVAEFMKRRAGITIKAALLMQERFPGIGNWMADEILWRACIHPSRRCGDLTDDEVAVLHSVCVWVANQAMAIIGASFADPPPSWLYHHRWQDGGKCPLTGVTLQRETIGGRTSCYCPSRQKMKPGPQNYIFMDDHSTDTGFLAKSSAWKAHASSLQRTTDGIQTLTSSKHGKKRGSTASSSVKNENDRAGVSPWGRQVRAGRAKASADQVIPPLQHTQLPRKKFKIEESQSQSQFQKLKCESEHTRTMPLSSQPRRKKPTEAGTRIAKDRKPEVIRKSNRLQGISADGGKGFTTMRKSELKTKRTL
jgi:hypothetical protein